MEEKCISHVEYPGLWFGLQVGWVEQICHKWKEASVWRYTRTHCNRNCINEKGGQTPQIKNVFLWILFYNFMEYTLDYTLHS